MRPRILGAAAALALAGVGAPALAAPDAASASAPAGPGYAAGDAAYKAADRGDLAEAERQARIAVGREPRNRNYRLLLISVLGRLGRTAEADRESAAYEATFGPDAQLSAQRGYMAQQAGDKARAREFFATALSLTGLSPDQAHDIRLTLADLWAEAGDQAAVLQALAPLAQERSYAVQSRRAYALNALGQTTSALEAFQVARAAATTDQQRGAMERGRIYALAKLGRTAEARGAFLAADKAGWLVVADADEAAELAASLGLDARAQELFAEAERKGQMKPSMWFDAAFSAERLGRKGVAARDFEHGLAAARAGQMTLPAQTTLQIRREVAELTRHWGAYASIFYGQNGTVGSTNLLNGRGVSQVGGEVYYRPEWSPWGAQVQVFGRAFETLDGPRGTATGGKTAQGWVGLEVKPLRSQNVVIEASRLMKIGSLAENDWMLRAAWSANVGLLPQPGRRDWPMWMAYVEGARLTEHREDLGFADLRYGRTFSLTRDGNWLAAPFVGAVWAYDNKIARRSALGAGPGLMVRSWFRETPDKAPQSYIDYTLQYRARVSGDRRAEGLFGTISLSY